MKPRNRKHPRFNTYDREFKQKVILFAEQQSTREAQKKYGIPESNVRRWRRLKERIFAKDPLTPSVSSVIKKKDKKKRHSKGVTKNPNDFYEYEIENVMLQDYDYNDSSSLDSVPLNQRVTGSSTSSAPMEQLHSQPLSPTKLKVTRQNNKSQKFTPIVPKPPEVPETNQNDEVCLRWNSHHTNMQMAFPNLLKKEQFVDVTLVADGKMLKCHRIILSSCSSYFEEILDSIEYNQHPVIFLKGIPFWILKSLTDFMYVGEVNIDQSKLQELLDVAEILKIKGLAGKSENSQESLNAKPDKEISKKFDQSHLSQPPVLEPQIKPPSVKPLPKRIERSERNEDDRRGSMTTVKPAILPPEQIPITDPLELLEPTYQEETRAEEEPSSSKQRELKMASRKAINKKIRKRKSPEIEESKVPIRLRRGTRSRPHVKVPKYYHNDYETQVHGGQNTNNDTDPLSHIGGIKTEPIELDVVGMTYNEVESNEDRLCHINDSEGDSEDVLITGIEADRVLVPSMVQDTKEQEKDNVVSFVSTAEGENPVPFVATVSEYTTDRSENDVEPRISVRLSTNIRKRRESVKRANELSSQQEQYSIVHIEEDEENAQEKSVHEIISNDSLEQESREVGLDISDTVVQTMDSDTITVQDGSENLHSPKDVQNENATNDSLLTEEKRDLVEEDTFAENGSRDSVIQEEDNIQNVISGEETSVISMENGASEVEPFASQVENIQITQVMSLNPEEADDSLMDIEENRLLDCNYEDSEQKTDEQETANMPMTEFDESLLENNVEEIV